MSGNYSDSSSSSGITRSHLISNATAGGGTTKSAGAGRYSLALDILEWLNLYYLGAIIVVGVLGNAINVIVFIRSNSHKLRSPNYYMAALASADVVFLAILFVLWLSHFDGIDLFSRNGVYQALFYTSSTSSSLSAWLVVAFTFERFIVVRYPLKRIKLCTVRRAKMIIGCLTVAVAIVQAVSLFPTGVIDTPTTKKGEPFKKKAGHIKSSAVYYQLMRAIAMLETVLTLVVPPCLIILMNGLIIYSLFHFNHFKTPPASIHDRHHHHQQRAAAAVNHDDIQMEVQQRDVIKCQQKRMSVDTCDIVKDDEPGSNNKRHHHHHQGTASDGNDSSSSSSNNTRHYVSTLVVLEKRDSSTVSCVHHQQSLESISSSAAAVANYQLSSPADLSHPPAQNEQLEIPFCTAVFDGGISVDMRPAPHLDERHHDDHSDLDAIQKDTISPSTDEGQVHVGTIVNLLQQNPSHNANLTEAMTPLKRHSVTLEYVVTKKLVLISTIHLLLNLPSYAMNLKVFIDRQVTLETWLLQQYSMLLYYTNFAINFLLYSTNSATFRNQILCAICNKCKTSQALVVADEA